MDCCGCGACAAICPVACVSMSRDPEGFPVPVINEAACVKCNMCKRVCPSLNDPREADSGYSSAYYAAIHKDSSVIKSSSSGGIFTALTDAFLKQGGAVYGCVLQNVSEAIHVRAASVEERNAMRGSKYIQSDLSGSYGQITDDLTSGIKVYFSGTPCQCAALRLFLKVKNVSAENLFLQEVLCHGIGSPALFKAYIGYMEKKFGGTAVRCKFRAKAARGKKQDMEIRFSNGKIYNAVSTTLEPFYRLYHTNYILRKSYYCCKYARRERVSDISLADFWGYKRPAGQVGDTDYSLAIFSSKKGAMLLSQCRDSVILWPSSYSQASQNSLKHPAPHPADRDRFRNDFLSHGFAYVSRWYGSGSFYSRCKIVVLWAARKTRIWNTLKKHLTK